MIRALLMDQPYWGTALGLILFLAIFIATLVWILRPGAKSEYRHDAHLPLDDGTQGAGKGSQG